MVQVQMPLNSVKDLLSKEGAKKKKVSCMMPRLGESSENKILGGRISRKMDLINFEDQKTPRPVWLTNRPSEVVK
jgi:hypothetical protein